MSNEFFTYRPQRNGVKISEHFWAYEFECRGASKEIVCCNGAVIADPQNIKMLEKFREYIKSSPGFKGFVLNRVYSCPVYNTKIGGEDFSKHLQGRGNDLLSQPTGHTTRSLGRAAVEFGNSTGLIKAVGCYDGYKGKHGFCHIQPDESPNASVKIGNVDVWGDFDECKLFYIAHPDLYKAKNLIHG